MNGAWWHPDGMLGWWLCVAGAALVVYGAGRLGARWDARRRARIHSGPAFVQPAHEGESVFQIASSDPPRADLGPAFPDAIETTGGFRHGARR